MLRLALTPRWLLGLAILIGLVLAAVLLGRWQWDRTHTILDAERAAISAPIPVQDVFAASEGAPAEVPSDGIGRPVTATGRYLPEAQVAVANRSLDGMPGVWIVTGLELSDGQVVSVLRGWLPTADDVAGTPPPGEVSVTGVLQPDEEFYADAATEPGVVASIASDRLAEVWGRTVLPGFVVLQSQEPSLSAAPSPVPPTVSTADVPFPLQNFFYAFQWWIFAAFGIALYLRWLWIEAGRQVNAESA